MKRIRAGVQHDDRLDDLLTRLSTAKNAADVSSAAAQVKARPDKGRPAKQSKAK